MNDDNFLINLVFKPDEKGVRLNPQLSQLLLAHIGEILMEVEEEEKKNNNAFARSDVDEV